MRSPCSAVLRARIFLPMYRFALSHLPPNLNQRFPIYDAMVTLVPVNFITLGIIGGGIASTLKRISGIDIRGRILEIIVVVLTLLLTGITSGLVRGYFGDPSRCWGILASSSPNEDGESSILKGPFYLSILNTMLIDIPLRQMKLWYLKWDLIFSKLGFVSRRLLCVPTRRLLLRRLLSLDAFHRPGVSPCR